VDPNRFRGAQNTRGCPAQTSSTIVADPGETPCLFAMQWLFSSLPSVTQMQKVWQQRTAQRGARPLGDTFDLGKDTVSLLLRRLGYVLGYQ
jgi:hypothetical protein